MLSPRYKCLGYSYNIKHDVGQINLKENDFQKHTLKKCS